MPTTPRRPTPFDLALPGGERAAEILSRIAEEASARGVDPTDPEAFLQLGEVGLALQEIRGGDRGAESIQGVGALLFHLFHFGRGGERILPLEREAAKRIVSEVWEVGAESVGAGESRTASDPHGPAILPWEAGYLQLPRHLFWADGTPAEAIDGVFWTAASGATLSLAVISGIVEGRPGFTIASFPPVPLSDAGGWPRLRARESGEDFATTLPGGDLSGLHSILTFGEVLKLVSRAFAFFPAEPA